ncbi:hypothetical protein AAVH_05832 [Aphelenchoides avenae]|nr:hypothetical protein AAVH_05832 [Aphelenchus avenae]
MPLLVNGRTLQELTEDWSPVEFPDDPVGGLRAEKDKGQLKMWTMKMADAVQFMHDQDVYHASLHPRNVILEPYPQRLCDLGRSGSLTHLDALDANAKRDEDIRCIAYLYVFGKCGYYEYAVGCTELPPQVEQVIFPTGHTAEKAFVKGVLNAADGELHARHLLCYPHFDRWQNGLPDGHRYKPASKDSESLEEKYFPKNQKAGEASKLKVRPAMRPILAGMDATHGNAPCHLYFTLAPLMIACEAEAAGQGNDAGKCPNGTLYECKSLMKHALPADTATAQELMLNGTPSQTAANELIKSATYRGQRNSIISKDLRKCRMCEKWVDVEAHLNRYSGAHEFRTLCRGCVERGAPGDFFHLAEVVELRVKRSDRKEPWTSFVDECSARPHPDNTVFAKDFKRLRKTKWIEPTHADFKSQGNEQ